MRTITSFLILLITTCALARTVWYVDDNTTNFANPERGFLNQYIIEIDQNTTHTDLTDAHFSNPTQSLMWRSYVLVGYRNDSLTQNVFDLINEEMALFRRHGWKMVVRFSYTYSTTRIDGKYADASPEIWALHLKQLKPLLYANQDVIAVVQAGFLGVWGEWGYSALGTITNAVRNTLIDQLLDAVPPSRAIQLRVPAYKQKYLGDTAALSSEEAYTGTARARLAHHNDAFLYESGNMGTYHNRTKDMWYISRETNYLPIGGESNVDNLPVYNKWARGDIAQEEMAYLHYSFLNQSFTELVIRSWKEEGAFEEIAKHMGYRLQMIQSEIPAVAATGDTLPVYLRVKNVGYATPFNERKAYIVLRSADTTYTFLLHSDPRRWLPNGAVTEVRDSLLLPEDMPLGTYDVCLWLPDIAPSLQADARYAIRLASEGVWEKSTGYNLLTSVEVDSIARPEPPEDEPLPQLEVAAATHLMGAAGRDCATLSWLNPPCGIITHTSSVDISKGTKTDKSNQLPDSAISIRYTAPALEVNYTTTSTWQWAGVMFPVKDWDTTYQVRYHYLGDANGAYLIAYVWDGVYRWIQKPYSKYLHAYWMLDQYTPTEVLWASNPTHRYGDRPITHVGFIANPATPMSGSFSIKDVQFITQEDISSDFAGVRVVRLKGRVPTSPLDGETIYYGRDSSLVDTGLVYGQTYYYAVYAFNTKGEIAYPAVCSVRIDGTGCEEPAENSTPATKYMRDGQLYILRNNHRYDMLGRPIE